MNPGPRRAALQAFWDCAVVRAHKNAPGFADLRHRGLADAVREQGKTGPYRLFRLTPRGEAIAKETFQ